MVRDPPQHDIDTNHGRPEDTGCHKTKQLEADLSSILRENLPTPETALITQPRRSLAAMVG